MFSKLHRLTFLAAALSLVLAACGSAPVTSWSGVALSTDSSVVYVAVGTHLYAVSADGSGKQIWSQPVASSGGGFLGLGNLFGGASPTPAAGGQNVSAAEFYANPVVAGDVLIASSYDKPQSAFALNIKDGTQKWVFPPAGDVSANKPADRLIGGPVVNGKVVYIPSADNTLYAVSLDDGHYLWSYKTEQSLWAAPLATDKAIYVPSMDHNLYALDPNGKLLWKQAFDGALAGSPAISDDGKILYQGSLNSSLVALDAATGAQIWKTTAKGWVWTTPLVAKGVVYFADLEGDVYAVDAATGVSKWAAPVELGGSIRGMPALTDGTLVVALDTDGVVFGLNAADGTQKWRHEIDPANADRLLSDLLVVGSNVLVVPVSATNLIYALKISDGSEAWTYKP